MVEDSAKEDWVRILTERPPEHEAEPWTVHCVGERRFTLLELVAAEDADVTPGSRVAVESEHIRDVQRRLTYHTLTQAAQDRLKPTITAIIQAHEQRFIECYNNAQPIGLRKHQLDVLPKIGDKRREAIIVERRQRPFADFADLETRVDSLSDPPALLVDRALTELREVEEARYKLLVAEEIPSPR